MGQEREERDQNVLSALLRFQPTPGKEQVALAISCQKDPSFRLLGA